MFPIMDGPLGELKELICEIHITGSFAHRPVGCRPRALLEII